MPFRKIVLLVITFACLLAAVPSYGAKCPTQLQVNNGSGYVDIHIEIGATCNAFSSSINVANGGWVTTECNATPCVTDHHIDTRCWNPGTYPVQAGGTCSMNVEGAGCSLSQAEGASSTFTVPERAPVAITANYDSAAETLHFDADWGLVPGEFGLEVDGVDQSWAMVGRNCDPTGSHCTIGLGFACSSGTHSVKVTASHCTSQPPLDRNSVTISAVAKDCPAPQQTSCCGSGPGSCAMCIGKPVHAGSGDVAVPVPLFAISGDPMPLKFDLTFHSLPPISTSLINRPLGGFGIGEGGWTHTFNQTVRALGPNRLQWFTETGDRYFFDRVGQSSSWVAAQPATARETVSMPDATHYSVNHPDGSSVLFDAATGNWLATKDRWGNAITGAYTGANLTSITDTAGRVIQLAYSASRIQSITLPDGGVWRIEYSGNGNPARIFDPLHTGTTPWRTISGNFDEMDDESGAMLEAHSTSYLPRLAVQVGTASYSGNFNRERITFSYDTPSVGQTTVREFVDGVARTRVFTTTKIRGSYVPTEIQGGCAVCGGSSIHESFEYDANTGDVTKKTDAAGNVTTLQHDAFGNVTTQVEAVGTAQERTTTAEFADPSWPTFPTKTIQASATGGGSKVRQAQWNADHTVLTTTDTGKLVPGGPDVTYTRIMTFDSRHRLLSSDGPRTDVNDVTTYVYYGDADANLNNRGRLYTITNAAGHVTTFENYDLFGAARKVTDPNGVVTELQTDARGRTTSQTLRAVAGNPNESQDFTTTWTYDTRDRLVLITTARGVRTRYVYENGTNWLTDIIHLDFSGNEVERRHLTLDSIGEKTKEEDQLCSALAATCTSWVTKRTESFIYDDKGRMTQVVHSDATRVVYTYDDNGRLISVQDENHAAPNTTYSYDALSRLAAVTQKLGSGTVATGYQYDVQDNLASVTDPNGNVTSYQYDDFRRMQKQISPVTGTTTYAYDPSGNLLSTTDANGASIARTYDVLGRFTISTSSKTGLPSEVLTWTYDESSGGPFAKGRLTSVSSPASSSALTYDRRGQRASETTSILGAPYTTSYAYDDDGNRTRIISPSGRINDYTFDYANRPYSVTSGGVAIVSATSYLPFGPALQMTFGNGTTRTMQFDSRYRVQRNQLTRAGSSLADYTYVEDNIGNVTQIHEAVDPAYNRDFGYDDLNRLTTANAGSSLWGSGSYTYDAMGNMTAATLGARTSSFAFAGTTPQITQATENGIARAITYDAAGNEATVGGSQYDYSARNELGFAEGVDYAYDAAGVRVVTSYPAASLASLTLSTGTLYDNQTGTATVTLAAPAPTGGARVTLSATAPSLSLPSSVMVPAGGTSAIFSVTQNGTNTGSATISGRYGAVSRTSSVTLAGVAPLDSIAAPSTASSGSTVQVTVTLKAPAPAGGTVVTITSSSATVTIPSAVTIAEGSTSTTFQATLGWVTSTENVTLTASYQMSVSTSIAVTPLAVASISVNPSTVMSSDSSTATVTMTGNAPASGAAISLATNDAQSAGVPATITVPSGESSRSATVTTRPTNATTSVGITATYGASTQSTTLTLTPCNMPVASAPTIASGEVPWVDDSYPAGTADPQQWDTTQKASGTRSLHTANGAGSHFAGVANFSTSGRVTPFTGDRLSVYLLLNPCALPREVRVEWHSPSVGWKGFWWGESLLGGESALVSQGPVPAGGTWQRFEVSAWTAGLENRELDGVRLFLYDGEGWVDRFSIVPNSCSMPNASAPTIPPGEVPWVDDSYPTGTADPQQWDTAQKASGTRSIRATNASGSHFAGVANFSTSGRVTPFTGDRLSVYLLLNPCALPREVRVEWHSPSVGWKGLWWGESLLGGESSLVSQGPVPAGGTWQRFEVSAWTAGLENRELDGVRLFLYDGEGWVDRFSIVPNSCSMPNASAPTIPPGEVPWVDDSYPTGTADPQQWDTAQKASGTRSIRATNAAGSHFVGVANFSTSGRIVPFTGDHLSFYLLLNPCAMPREVQVEWHSPSVGWKGLWWGESLLGGESSLVSQGAVPAGGTWQRFEVSAWTAGLENRELDGVRLFLYDGEGWVDRFSIVPNSCTMPNASAPTIPPTEVPWIDDSYPTGTADPQQWDTAQKASGTRSLRVVNSSGDHSAGNLNINSAGRLTPATGDHLSFYLLLNPCAMPREVQVLWHSPSAGWKGMWWGESLLGSESTYLSQGTFPAGGTWLRVDVAAAAVGLENIQLDGIKIRLYDGEAWADRFALTPASAVMNRHGRIIQRMIATAFRGDDEPSISLTARADVLDAPSATHRYSLYTPELQLAAETETTSSATPSVAYEYVWFAGQPVAQVETATNAVHYYFTDHLGTPVLTTDATGTVDWRVEREPYGRKYALRAGATRHQPLAFPGQEEDGTDDKSYNIFRWYRAGWGRYTQADPLLRRFAAWELPYMYVDDSPTNAVDPVGLYSIATVHRIISRYPKKSMLPPVCKGQLSCTDFERDFDKDSSLQCSCSPDCHNNWSPHFSAVLAYDMFLSSEQPFANDPWHEVHETAHITDIINDVGDWLDSLERQSFTKEQCNAICKASIGLFKQKVTAAAAASQKKSH